MDRKEFLSTFGLGLAAICAGGCLASCSKSSTDTPGGGTVNPPTGVNFTVDLNNEIKNVGESLIRNGVIVVRLQPVQQQVHLQQYR
jgi:cytochrome b6-f complex iron-sulfur subunit